MTPVTFYVDPGSEMSPASVAPASPLAPASPQRAAARAPASGLAAPAGSPAPGYFAGMPLFPVTAAPFPPGAPARPSTSHWTPAQSTASDGQSPSGDYAYEIGPAGGLNPQEISDLLACLRRHAYRAYRAAGANDCADQS